MRGAGVGIGGNNIKITDKIKYYFKILSLNPFGSIRGCYLRPKLGLFNGHLMLGIGEFGGKIILGYGYTKSGFLLLDIAAEGLHIHSIYK